MDDKMKEVIDQYEVEIKNVYRARGAYMLETTDGLKMVREFRSSKERAEQAQTVKEALRDKGFVHTDLYVRNKNGDIITENAMGNRYAMKNWFVGEECNLKELDKVEKAAENLAVLHKKMEGILPEPLEMQGDTFSVVIEKHNRELRRVRSYIREKKQRNEFELLFLSLFSEFYSEAEEAESLLKEVSEEELYQGMKEQQTLCHGSYNYHNVLFTKNGIATTNFEKVQLQLQVMDLYDFIRKVMEKNNWSEEFFYGIMENYEKVKTLTKEERKLISLWMSYPEKFWKVTNYYYNSKKTWISAKNIEKLQSLQQQKKQRRALLRKIF